MVIHIIDIKNNKKFEEMCKKLHILVQFVVDSRMSEWNQEKFI
jgi:hypothetical protein